MLHRWDGSRAFTPGVHAETSMAKKSVRKAITSKAAGDKKTAEKTVQEAVNETKRAVEQAKEAERDARHKVQNAIKEFDKASKSGNSEATKRAKEVVARNTLVLTETTRMVRLGLALYA